MSSFDYTFDQLMDPALQAIQQLGGSATNSEIEAEVVKLLKLTEEQANDIHRGTITKLDYRLRWARNYLKRAGLIENSGRGVWSLTEKGKARKKIDAKEIVRSLDALRYADKTKESQEPAEEPEEEVEQLKWQEELLAAIKKMSPASFERLSQRLLRELGFKNVEVTGKAGDGGIDGKGMLSIGSVLTFRVVFQCKRYRDTVTAGVVRDFRGAVQGRADKGLLVTTGRFTQDARIEAQRDGALAIDLMDGSELAEKVKELSLGVKTEMVERVIVIPEWFAKL